jgi:N-acetylglucosamine-6-phosphate deacetylase
MIAITGAVLVLPDGLVDEGSIILDGDRIAAIEPHIIDLPSGAARVDARGGLIVPGFIDVHVHGVEGIDVLDGPGAVLQVAERLAKHGVTAFCPTTVACTAPHLDAMLADVAAAARSSQPIARVLPAHLESNFINPEYKGAQPEEHLCAPALGQEILSVLERRREQVGIVTMAPELDGGLDLVQRLSAAGHRVSIGHTGATYEQAVDAIAAGVTHATHLFNRMTPMSHRAPGVPGAVLQSESVAAELVCDSFHVHPALLRVAIRAKGLHGICAITDGTAGSGLPVGSCAKLGGRRILVTERTAELEDGTIAGSVLTMDGAFRVLVRKVGLSVVEAAHLCSTTPAERLRLAGTGGLIEGNLADLVILDRETLRVRATFVAGRLTGEGGHGGTGGGGEHRVSAKRLD